MWNLAKMCAVVAICLGATGGGWANADPRANSAQSYALRPGSPMPIATVSAPQKPLQFGRVSGPGAMRLKAEVPAHVVANCPFRLAASFQGFTEVAGRKTAIPPAQLVVKINGKEVPIGTDRVQIATGRPTPPTGVDVPVVIEMEVKGASSYPAGRYGGNLALSVLRGS